MSSDTGGLVTIICLLVFLIAAALYSKSRNKKIDIAKKNYRSALESGDKQRALKAGREYYSILRWGRLSVYDEQAINNDLSAMK